MCRNESCYKLCTTDGKNDCLFSLAVLANYLLLMMYCDTSFSGNTLVLVGRATLPLSYQAGAVPLLIYPLYLEVYWQFPAVCTPLLCQLCRDSWMRWSRKAHLRPRRGHWGPPGRSLFMHSGLHQARKRLKDMYMGRMEAGSRPWMYWYVDLLALKKRNENVLFFRYIVHIPERKWMVLSLLCSKLDQTQLFALFWVGKTWRNDRSNRKVFSLFSNDQKYRFSDAENYLLSIWK